VQPHPTDKSVGYRKKCPTGQEPPSGLIICGCNHIPRINPWATARNALPGKSPTGQEPYRARARRADLMVAHGFSHGEGKYILKKSPEGGSHGSPWLQPWGRQIYNKERARRAALLLTNHQ